MRKLFRTEVITDIAQATQPNTIYILPFDGDVESERSEIVIIDNLGNLTKATVKNVSELINDGDGLSPFTTEEYVATVIAAAALGLLNDRGSYNASGGTYPTTGGSGLSGAIKKGDLWYISVAGTIDGIVFNIGDSIRALVDTPAQTTANWATTEGNLGYVPENTNNKQNSLAPDGTGTKFATVDAIIAALTAFMTTNTDQEVTGVKTFRDGKFGFRNALNTFTSFFTNSNTASRTYTFPNKSMTVAGIDDVATKLDIPTGGLANRISKFLTPTSLGNSRLFDNGNFFGIGTINTPTKDITLDNIENKEIGVEDSESTNSGRDLVVTAGRTVNYLLNAEFSAISLDQYQGSGVTSAPNGDIYFQGFSAGLYKLTLGTNIISSVPAQGFYNGGISIGYDESIYQTPYNGGVLIRNNITVSGTSAYTTLGILSSKFSNKLYASFNGSIQYSTDNGVSFTVIQAGSIGIGKICEDSFGNVYALISGFLWKQTLGTGLFVNTTIPLVGDSIAIDTNNNIFSVNDSNLYKLTYGSTVYSLFKDISTLNKGSVTGIAIDTDNRIFISCGLNNFSLQFQLFTDVLGTPDLPGGTLYLDAGTGKGEGSSKVVIRTGQKTTSGTNMQELENRLMIDEEGVVKLFAYPSSRNDGALPINKILSVDASGNLKLYSMPIMPPPYLEELIPDSYLPETTGNFRIVGSFFTPTTTVAIEGQTLNYLTFISDNEMLANITTGATEGVFDLIIDNGISVTFPDALLIVLGEVYKPKFSEGDWIDINEPVDLETDGELKVELYDSVGSATLNPANISIQPTIDFRFVFNIESTPFEGLPSVAFTTLVTFYRVSDDVPVYQFLFYLSGGLIGGSPNHYGAIQMKEDEGLTVTNNNDISGISPKNWNRTVRLQRVSGVMALYIGTTLLRTFDYIETAEMYVKFETEKVDFLNIKYIELI